VEDFDTLITILYSNTFNEKKKVSVKCYYPRHGLLLYNHSGNSFGFIEICFECFKIKTTDTIPPVNTLSETGFRTLKRILEEYGE